MTFTYLDDLWGSKYNLRSPYGDSTEIIGQTGSTQQKPTIQVGKKVEVTSTIH